MQEGTASPTGKRFANDLRRIRENRGISIEDLYSETKIPRGLLESFEESGLFEHPMFNRVYLRSFVRTYADVVGISPEIALEALEQAVESTYEGRLEKEYLASEVSPEEKEDVSVGTPKQEEMEAVEAKSASEAIKTDEEKEEPHSPTVTEEIYTEEPRESREPVVTDENTPEKIETQSWVSQSPPVSSPSARGKYQERNGGNWKQWVVIGLAVVVLGGIAWFVIANVGDTDEVVTGPEMREVSSAADTLGTSDPQETSISLRDTLQATIIAADGKVQNIKVTVDDDLRRPYWIETGQSKSFDFTNKIIIERQLDKIGLEINGRDYPTDRRDEMGRIVITRDSVFTYLQGQA